MQTQYSRIAYYCLCREIKEKPVGLDEEVIYLIFYDSKKKQFTDILSKDCLYGSHTAAQSEETRLGFTDTRVQPVRLVPDDSGTEYDEEEA